MKSLRCRLGYHAWPTSAEMPVVDADEAMVIRCRRCLQSAVVWGWLRDAFRVVERT